MVISTILNEFQTKPNKDAREGNFKIRIYLKRINRNKFEIRIETRQDLYGAKLNTVKVRAHNAVLSQDRAT